MKKTVIMMLCAYMSIILLACGKTSQDVVEAPATKEITYFTENPQIPIPDSMEGFIFVEKSEEGCYWYAVTGDKQEATNRIDEWIKIVKDNGYRFEGEKISDDLTNYMIYESDYKFPSGFIGVGVDDNQYFLGVNVWQN